MVVSILNTSKVVVSSSSILSLSLFGLFFLMTIEGVKASRNNICVTKSAMKIVTLKNLTQRLSFSIALKDH